MTYRLIFAMLVALPWAVSATALEADQVRGEIVEISSDEEILRLRVEAAGDERQATPGTVAEYRITDDTQVQMEDPMESLLEPRLDDLSEGAQVILDFEDVNGELMARNVQQVDDGAAQSEVAAMEGAADPDSATGGGVTGTTQETGDGDAGSGRAQLPSTASLLPLMALAGGGFALLALGVRRFRSRR